jgi:hypothetical protein
LWQVLVAVPAVRPAANGQNLNVFFDRLPCFFDRSTEEF